MQLLRKIVAALILVPLAIVIIAFAVANRQIVTVSLDPFGAEQARGFLTLPLFALVIVLLDCRRADRRHGGLAAAGQVAARRAAAGARGARLARRRSMRSKAAGGRSSDYSAEADAARAPAS